VRRRGRRAGLVRLLSDALVVIAPAVTGAPVPSPLARAPFADAVAVGAITNPRIREASGLAPSLRRSDLLWLLNDSGNSPDLFAVTTNGAEAGVVRIEGPDNEDWEDLASFRLDGAPYLLVADCGDNPGFRGECLLHAVPEPDVPGPSAVRPMWTLRYRYEDGPRDCESVAVDAARARVLLLSKDNRIPVLYELPLRPADATAIQTARRLGELRTIPPPVQGLSRGILARIGSLTTSMDLAPDGRRLAVLTYEHAYLLECDDDGDWASALARAPLRIELPDPLDKTLRKREALCWTADGRALFVTGEQVPAPLFRAGAWRMDAMPEPWTFTGFEGAKDLSGIAAAPGGPALVVSDELGAAQAARIDTAARTVTAGPLVPLLPDGAEADLEGVAVSGDGRTFYATGSHGVGKKKGDIEPSRRLVHRIRAPTAGAAFGPAETSAALMDWVGRNPVLGPHAGRPLQQNGFNIEGLAWRDGRLWFGVRAPNLDGEAFVIEAEPGSLFAGAAPTATLHRVRIGPGLGFREIAAVRDGFILLAGEACAEASKQIPESLAAAVEPGYSFFWWRPGAASAVPVGRLPDAPGKAEGLLVLRDDDEAVDVLVLFDGPPQGAPRVFRLHRP
jgi:hypothetical protein